MRLRYYLPFVGSRDFLVAECINEVAATGSLMGGAGVFSCCDKCGSLLEQKAPAIDGTFTTSVSCRNCEGDLLKGRLLKAGGA